jgi:hypothetical protein
MLSSLRGMPDEMGLGGYFAALSDIPDDIMRRAIGHALRTRSFFPTPAEIRLDCDAVSQRERAQASTAETYYFEREAERPGYTAEIRNPFGGPHVTVKVVDGWRDECDECRDTGQAMAWCGAEPSIRAPWLPVQRCSRRAPHYEHEWAYACPCVPTNRTIQRKKDAMQRYAKEPETVGSRR